MSPMKQISVWRWEILAAFLFNVISVVVVSILLTHSVDNNQRNIRELQRQKVSIHGLEHANCALRKLLLPLAVATRKKAAQESGAKAKYDRKQARITKRLADSYANEFCPKA